MISCFRRFVSILFAALALLTAQNAFAGFPTASGGSSTCFFGCDPTTSTSSTLVFDFNPDNDNGLAPVAINFFPYPNNENVGDLCWSGKVSATVYNHVSASYPSTGTATYNLLSSDGKNKGMCYSNVTRSIKSGSEGTMSNGCTYQTYIYSLVLNDAALTSSGGYDNTQLAALLNGQFKVVTDDPNYPTEGAFDECDVNPSAKICDIHVGFGVRNDPTNFIGFENLFPSETTLSGEPTNNGQVYFSDEVLVACDPTAVGITDSDAIDAKSSKIYLSESLSMNAHWCTDAYSSLPDCNAFNPDNTTQRATGQIKTAIGDYQTQNADAICIDSMNDLRNLSSCSQELALATCASSPDGFMTFPDAYVGDTCTDENLTGYDVETFFFTSAQGGGSTTANIVAIGANPDAPGYIGDNTLPPILPGWTAIVSTPDNQPNNWDLSGIIPVNIAYIHVRNNDDRVLGTLKGDNILGGSGADELNGNDGNDTLQGGDNTDTLNGDDGNDLLLGYECNSINATCGTYLNNGSDDDILNGGNGNDCLDGGRGNDTYTGGPGNDAFVLFGNADSDTVTDYTPGEDVIVDMTGKASASVVGSRKDGTQVCVVSSGGNNTMTLVGLTSCKNVVIKNVTAAGVDLPTQCTGHPFSYLP